MLPLPVRKPVKQLVNPNHNLNFKLKFPNPNLIS